MTKEREDEQQPEQDLWKKRNDDVADIQNEARRAKLLARYTETRRSLGLPVDPADEKHNIVKRIIKGGYTVDEEVERIDEAADYATEKLAGTTEGNVVGTAACIISDPFLKMLHNQLEKASEESKEPSR